VTADELVLAYLDRARAYSRVIGRTRAVGLDPEDAESWGLVGLVEAAKRRDPAREAEEFWVFAKRRILGAILDEARRSDPLARGHRQEVKAGKATAPVHVEFDETLQKPSNDVGTSVADRMSARDMQRLLRHLPERLQSIARMRFVDDLSLEEIGEKLGVTGGRICQLMREAEERIRIRLLPYDPNVDEERRMRWRLTGGCKVRRTHCLRGHPLDGYNLIERPKRTVRKNGSVYIGVTRTCRRCMVERTRRCSHAHGTVPLDAFRPPRHKLAKLTNDQVRAVLEALHARQRVTHVAARFSVSRRVIRLIRDGLCYRDVPRPPGFTGKTLPRGTLRPEDARNIVIRIERGERNKDLAAEYGVSPSTISDIRYGRYWTKFSGHLRQSRPRKAAA
jgi:RNA polymerase sigma factor FliA